MSVTQYYKTVKLTPIESAVVYVALAALSDKLAAQIESGQYVNFSVGNMRQEWAAAQSAMKAIDHAKFEAVTLTPSPAVPA